LPAPGAPVTPTRNARPECPTISRMSASPASRSSSTMEMPRAIARGSPITMSSDRSDNQRNLSLLVPIVQGWYNAHY